MTAAKAFSFLRDSGPHESSLPTADLSLGIAALNRILGGGLPKAALHEIAPAASIHLCAAMGFALALSTCTKKGQAALFIQTDFGRQEAGLLYGPGLGLFGISSSDCVILRVRRAIDALYVMEEALKSSAVSSVMTELASEGEAADLTATRRLSLAARAGHKPGFLLRHRPSAIASAAMTRWHVAAAPGRRDGFGGLSATAFHAALLKNRRGPCGEWILHWNHHERAFLDAADSIGLVEAASDRQTHTPFRRAG